MVLRTREYAGLSLTKRGFTMYLSKHKGGNIYGVVDADGQFIEGFKGTKEEAEAKANELNEVLNLEAERGNLDKGTLGNNPDAGAGVLQTKPITPPIANIETSSKPNKSRLFKLTEKGWLQGE